MKVGIEAQRIFRKNKHGMDVVALESMSQIQLLDQSNQYILFARNGPDKDCLPSTPNFHHRIFKGVSYADWEQINLPAAIRKTRPDLIHCTANTAPLRCPVPLLLTLHDIIYLEEMDMNGSAYQNVGNLYRKFVVPNAIKTARKIVTVSEFEKRVIVARYPATAEKITVIHNGVGERFRFIHDESKLEQVKKQYRLPRTFILFLGNTAPKKNTATVIKAYAHYCYIEKDPLPIVITDYPREKVLKQLEEINKPELIRNFILPGYIPSSQMPFLYNCAFLFLYPSLRESFGLPVLEAMACGVPVITSNTSALPEIAGDAAAFVDPTNVENIANAIQNMLTDDTYRNGLIQNGLARVDLFRWQKTAKRLISLYESVRI